MDKEYKQLLDDYNYLETVYHAVLDTHSIYRAFFEAIKVSFKSEKWQEPIEYMQWLLKHHSCPNYDEVFNKFKEYFSHFDEVKQQKEQE